MWASADGSAEPRRAQRLLAKRHPQIVLVDNYDSFTYNLAHALELAGACCRVVRHDAADVAQLLAAAVDGFVLSAGPCTPAEAGISVELVRALCGRYRRLPLLGVCLGHQVIASALGGSVQRAQRPVHGKLCAIRHDGGGVFAGLPNPLEATCYNSLVVREHDLPAQLVPCARNLAGELMAVRHRVLPILGVQFHPESVLSRSGPMLLRGWVETVRASMRRGCAGRIARAG